MNCSDLQLTLFRTFITDQNFFWSAENARNYEGVTINPYFCWGKSQHYIHDLSKLVIIQLVAINSLKDLVQFPTGCLHLWHAFMDTPVTVHSDLNKGDFLWGGLG